MVRKKKKIFFSVFQAAVTGLKPSSPERIGHVNYQKKGEKKAVIYCSVKYFLWLDILLRKIIIEKH